MSGPPALTLAGRVAALAGWRRAAAALALGALAAAAQPPLFLLPVLFVSFTGLIWLLDGAVTRRAAFGIGWLFGAGYFAAGLYWVSNALLVDAARFAWLIPFAVTGLSFGLGLFGGVATLLARLVWRPGGARVLALAAAWTAAEMLRGVVLTGFPWNPVGNVWAAVPAVLQTASVVGVYGLGLLTLLVAGSPAVLSPPARRAWRLPAAAGALLAVLAAAGEWRLATAETGDVAGVMLRIVQPNIGQRDKWRAENRARNYALQLRLSGERGDGRITHVIWPETAAPFSVPDDHVRRGLMRRAVPPGGHLITGSPRFAQSGGRLTGAWNSLVAVDDSGAVAAVYDKHHLVPFGEYVPFRSVLPIEKITAGAIDFSPGPGLTTMLLPGLPPFSPLICYEAIFPGAVAAAANRPAWLLNITNDGWFGLSAGPHQHFASARLRAVEEGLPMVRAANTGISAVVDSYGRVRRSLGLDRRGTIDSALPRALAAPPPFARYGNLIPAVLVIACFAFLAVFRR